LPFLLRASNIPPAPLTTHLIAYAFVILAPPATFSPSPLQFQAFFPCNATDTVLKQAVFIESTAIKLWLAAQKYYARGVRKVKRKNRGDIFSIWTMHTYKRTYKSTGIAIEFTRIGAPSSSPQLISPVLSRLFAAAEYLST
jgi:hypothetical protein